MKTKLFIIILLYVSSTWCAYSQTQFWGTTMWGGATNQGTIFRADANGGNFQVAYSFVNATGAMPLGGVTLSNNGKLYGVTELGGFGDSCVVYCYDPATGVYNNIHDFFQNTQLGYNAVSPMTNTVWGQLYGLTNAGGTNGNGVIYRVDPATNSYYDEYNFSGTDGSSPMGSLRLLSNGKLYGTTSYGGANSSGVIFSYEPFNHVYSKLYDFNIATGGHPQYGAFMQATNSKIYGLTYFGGLNGYGVLFSFDPVTNAYADLYDFDGTTGSSPEGTLIQATNGLIYGITYDGGAANEGVIFSFDITTNVYTDLFDFGGLNGMNPQRGLTQAGNGKLYGTTVYGGANSAGVAFQFNIITGIYTKLTDFGGGTLGGNPDCNMLETPILTPTGISETSPANGAAAYPNPATSSLTVTGAEQDELVKFTDDSGKELLSLKINAYSKTDVDISRFPNVFFITRQNGASGKIVKQ